MNICLADNQDITRAGMQLIISELFSDARFHRATDKTELIEWLKSERDSMVVIDYTLFDLNGIEDLQILHDRFPEASWIIFCVEVSADFAKRIIAMGQSFCILLKESGMYEIKECVKYSARRQRYICQRMSEILLTIQSGVQEEDVKLTPTETEILKDIALGMTTKEIAEKRFSSFHTVNTHRKNIFRKIGVNNIHEATKYALRAGLVDSAEYYI